jgi:hypothetical protein
MKYNKPITNHRFIDEAGDTTFYLKGKKSALNQTGVSNCFLIGMVEIYDNLEDVRNKIIHLQNEIVTNPFFNVPSVQKKVNNNGYYLHATDDIPEVRLKFLELIKTINCSFEAVVAEKSIERYETKHKGKEEFFYADLLSHLLKTKLQNNEKLVLHVSERGKSTKNYNLELALQKAKQRLQNNEKTFSTEITTHVIFNVNYPTNEPLLNLSDYFCWAIQRVFEKGETRYYEFLKEKISLVIDLYDTEKYKNQKNYYSPTHPLTKSNKKNPSSH